MTRASCRQALRAISFSVNVLITYRHACMSPAPARRAPQCRRARRSHPFRVQIVAAGASCTDKDVCTGPDTCGTDGVCSGDAIPCNPPVCMVNDGCDAVDGCQFKAKACNDPAPCEVPGSGKCESDMCKYDVRNYASCCAGPTATRSCLHRP